METSNLALIYIYICFIFYFVHTIAEKWHCWRGGGEVHDDEDKNLCKG
jgi:hypothetical protein